MAPTSDPPPSTVKAQTVAQAGGIMVASLLLSRVLGLVRNTAQAAIFGVGLHTDAYNIAFTIPDMLFMLIAGGGLSSAFIPVFSEFIHTEREGEAWKLFSVVVTFCSIVVTALIVLASVFAGPIGAYMGAGKPHIDEMLPMITQMGRILLPAQFAFLVGSLLNATLYARNRFAVPGLSPNIYNLGTIIGAMLGPALGLGIVGMAWGALFGAIVGNLLFPGVAMIRLGGHFKPSLDLKAPGVGKFFRLLGPVIFGFSLPSVAQLISQKFASPYGDGMNTVINYSNTLMQAPLGIFGQSLALAAFPVLSQFFAQNRIDLYRSQMNRTIRTVVYLSVPAAIFLGVFAPEIVSLLYGYGRARNASELVSVVACLRVYSIGIVAWSMQPVLMRGFFSLHKTLEPVLLSTGMTALFILLLSLQSPTGPLHLPLGGAYLCIPWSANIAATLLIVILYFTLQKHVGKLDLAGLGLTLAKASVGGVAMGGTGWALQRLFPSHPGKIVLFLATGSVFLLTSWIYLWVTMKLGMPETEYVRRGLDRFKSKFSGAS